MQQTLVPGKFVRKSNALARGKWQPKSIWESRIVALVASKVHEGDHDFHEYRIPVAELAGVPDDKLSGAQYTEIAKSICNLGGARILIPGKRPRNFTQYTIFATVGYEDGELVAQFHPDLKPHFLVLKEQFTVYSLFEFLMLPSTYSQRIFEMLKSWANCPDVTLPLPDLHEILCTPDSLRANFKDFRRRVLDKAYRDIAAKTSLRFEWEPVREGRTVTAIRFIFDSEKALKGGKRRSMRKNAPFTPEYGPDTSECSLTHGTENFPTIPGSANDIHP